MAAVIPVWFTDAGRGWRNQCWLLVRNGKRTAVTHQCFVEPSIHHSLCQRCGSITTTHYFRLCSLRTTVIIPMAARGLCHLSTNRCRLVICWHKLLYFYRQSPFKCFSPFAANLVYFTLTNHFANHAAVFKTFGCICTTLPDIFWLPFIFVQYEKR